MSVNCSWSGTQKELADLYLRKLEIRFENKIEYSDYYLSYSGGKDSHLIYWFIKEYLKTDKIPIVSVNTRLEHKEIMQRMYRNADIVLIPTIKPMEIKNTFGIPCFTKAQDEYIKRYQHGNRSEHTLSRIMGTTPSKHNLNKKAREITLSGAAHKISNECCIKTKKETLAKYERETGKRAIIGVRTVESINRQGAYHTCLSKNGKFSPIYDFPEIAVNAIYQVYNIETPKLYQCVKRTGCIGCPYINDPKRIEQDLALATLNQRKYIIQLFKESYDVKSVNYAQFLNNGIYVDSNGQFTMSIFYNDIIGQDKTSKPGKKYNSK